MLENRTSGARVPRMLLVSAASLMLLLNVGRGGWSGATAGSTPGFGIPGSVLYAAGAPQAPQPPRVPPRVRERARPDGRVRVIVELRLPSPVAPEGALRSAAAVAAQRGRIAAISERLRSRLPAGSHRTVRQFQTIPYIVLDVTPAALDALEAQGEDVVRVMDDEILRPELADSVPLVEGDQVWTAGYDGSGSVVAVLDTGVDRTHPFLGGKVVEEACYSTTQAGLSESFCPNALDEQIGTGAGAPCPVADCLHGTHVAGIAAGRDPNAGEPPGVAPAAGVMAVQVFSKVVDPAHCPNGAPCTGAFSSDVLAALERVYVVALEGEHAIAAANLSLAGGLFTAHCDDQPYKPIIDNLRAIGVATVAAAGNSGIPFALAAPACISSAVSVGATDKNDAVAWFSNGASFLSLLAPGESIRSAVPGGDYATFGGTSMAAPHVAGAWALMRQASPGTDVSTVLEALRSTGVPIADSRFFGTNVVPRVRLLRALATLAAVTNPAPAISAISPASVQAGAGPLTLTVTGTSFNTFSTVEWNGVAMATLVRSTTTLEATIPAARLANAGSAQVTVFTPAPGGGRSVALNFTITPGPSLSVDRSSVAPGGTVTAALEHGYGGASDWLALAAAGAPDASYLKWTYVGSGVASRTWSVAMPSTTGTYEFRLFVNSQRAATSGPVVVDASLNAVPGVASLSPATAVAGGGAPILLNVYGSNFVPSSVVRWNGADRATTYVSSWQLRISVPAADTAAAGVAQVSVFTPAPGGGSSASLPFTIAPQPVLGVSAATVVGGSPVTVTLTGGTGGSGDWLALATTSSPNTSYIQYTYVGAGVTTRTWTVNVPATAGSYEFRLFGTGYTRLATSPVVSVPAGAPVVTSLSPSVGPVGGAAFTLTVNGTGFSTSSIVRWNGTDRVTTFVSAAQLRASITAADLSSAGTALVSVWTPPPGGGSSAALPFEIRVAPVLAVSATAVSGGSAVTVTLTNGFGGALDWIALAPVGSPATSYLTYTYVGSGVTTRTWTVSMPASGGSYEFRLFLNNGYTVAATSPAVAVTAGAAPVLSVDKASAAPGSSITVTLTGGPGGATDWLAFAASGAANTSFVKYIYVGSGVTTRTWTVQAPSTPGTYEFRLFLNNGYTRAATSPVVVVQ